MKVNLALLESGVGAVSFYVQEIEHICKVKGTHQEQPLIDPVQSKKALREWIEAMAALWKA